MGKIICNIYGKDFRQNKNVVALGVKVSGRDTDRPRNKILKVSFLFSVLIDLYQTIEQITFHCKCSGRS